MSSQLESDVPTCCKCSHIPLGKCFVLDCDHILCDKCCNEGSSFTTIIYRCKKDCRSVGIKSLAFWYSQSKTLIKMADAVQFSLGGQCKCGGCKKNAIAVMNHCNHELCNDCLIPMYEDEKKRRMDFMTCPVFQCQNKFPLIFIDGILGGCQVSKQRRRSIEKMKIYQSHSCKVLMTNGKYCNKKICFHIYQCFYDVCCGCMAMYMLSTHRPEYVNNRLVDVVSCPNLYCEQIILVKQILQSFEEIELQWKLKEAVLRSNRSITCNTTMCSSNATIFLSCGHSYCSKCFLRTTVNYIPLDGKVRLCRMCPSLACSSWIRDTNLTTISIGVDDFLRESVCRCSVIRHGKAIVTTRCCLLDLCQKCVEDFMQKPCVESSFFGNEYDDVIMCSETCVRGVPKRFYLQFCKVRNYVPSIFQNKMEKNRESGGSNPGNYITQRSSNIPRTEEEMDTGEIKSGKNANIAENNQFQNKMEMKRESGASHTNNCITQKPSNISRTEEEMDTGEIKGGKKVSIAETNHNQMEQKRESGGYDSKKCHKPGSSMKSKTEEEMDNGEAKSSKNVNTAKRNNHNTMEKKQESGGSIITISDASGSSNKSKTIAVMDTDKTESNEKKQIQKKRESGGFKSTKRDKPGSTNKSEAKEQKDNGKEKSDKKMQFEEKWESAGFQSSKNDTSNKSSNLEDDMDTDEANSSKNDEESLHVNSLKIASALQGLGSLLPATSQCVCIECGKEAIARLRCDHTYCYLCLDSLFYFCSVQSPMCYETVNREDINKLLRNLTENALKESANNSFVKELEDDKSPKKNTCKIPDATNDHTTNHTPGTADRKKVTPDQSLGTAVCTKGTPGHSLGTNNHTTELTDHTVQSSDQTSGSTEHTSGAAATEFISGGSNYASTEKIKGVRNLGMTCYANCIFQILGQTNNLRDRLMKSMIEEMTKNVTPPLTENLTALLEQLCGQGSSESVEIEVRNFLQKMVTIEKSFQRYLQNDCCEFLMCILETLKSENEATTLMFENILQTFFRCRSCRHVELGRPQISNSLLIPLSKGQNSFHSVTAGLARLLKTEKLGKDVLPCKICNMKGDSMEQGLVLTKLPEILIIQIGRVTSKKFFWRYAQKKDDLVEYDANIEVPLTVEVNGKAHQRIFNFSLFGVILHSGSIDGGHYYSYVKKLQTDKWFYCNDSSVFSMQTKHIFGNQNAYLLFYEKGEMIRNDNRTDICCQM